MPDGTAFSFTPDPLPQQSASAAAPAFSFTPDPPPAQAVSPPAPVSQPVSPPPPVAPVDQSTSFSFIPDPAPATAARATVASQPVPPESAPSDQPAPPEEGGFFSGLISGAGAATTEGARLAQGQAFTTDPSAQPEPQHGWFNELGYGIGHSFPVIGAGLGGGAAGGAVGGPVGAVAGAALGVGGMSFVQDLVPTYDAAVRGGMSHDEAIDYSIKHAAASGVINAAMAPLFELAPFRSVIGRILFQSLVTQPVAGGAARVGVPAVLGEPLPSAEEMVRGAGQDIVTGAAFGVGHQVGARVYGAVRGRPGEAPPAGEEAPPTEAPPTEAPPAVSEAPPAPGEVAPTTVPAPAPEASQPAQVPGPEAVVPAATSAPEPSSVAAPVREETPAPPPAPTVSVPEPPRPAVEQAPAPETIASEPLSAGTSVVWRAAEHDYPVTATGEEQSHTDGRVYAQVRQPDGTLSYVPKDELVVSPPSDRLGAPAERPLPAAPVGEAGAAGLPAGQLGGGGEGDQVPRPGDIAEVPPGGVQPPPTTEPRVAADIAPAPRRAAPTLALPEQASGPTGDAQLDRLIATRDRADTNSARAAVLDRQIEARQATLEAKGGPRVGGRKTEFTGPPRVGTEKDPIRDYKFNNGTSVYRSVFEQAGHNPDTAVNKPIVWQNKVLADHMEKTLGFRSVEIAPDARGMVDQKITRDAMLDLTRASQDMMASLKLPASAASLNGRLKLVFDPEGKRGYYGRYSTSGEINIAGGANSFGHEWTHAVDHFLNEQLLSNPQAHTLLTRATREGQLDPKAGGVEAAFAKVLNTMFYDRAGEATRRIDLAARAAKTDRLGNPTKAALEVQNQLALLERGASNLRIPKTEFRAAAGRTAKPEYYGDPAELLARAHEAWIARKMQNEGMDPRGAVMPDEAYIKETNKMFGDHYPQAEDRMNIFKAFDELHDQMQKADILGEGKVPEGSPNLGISDPAHWGKTVPGMKNTPAGREVATVVNGYKNKTRALLNETTTFNPDRPDPGNRPLKTRAGDIARATTYSHHGIMETIIARAPKEAQRILRSLMDRVAAAPGEGRYTGENYEEAVRNRSRSWTGGFGKILKGAGYKSAEHLSVEEDAMLRHVLTTGDTRYPTDPNDLSGTGTTKAIPQNLIRAGGQLRQLMDQIWRATHDAGIDVGYARSGYYPRLYDALKITANAAAKDRFLNQARNLHRLMIDQELGAPGSNPEATLEKWTADMSSADRNSMPNGANAQRELAGHMAELQAALRERAQAEAEGRTGDIPALQARAEAAAAAAHPFLRDHIAHLEASNWLTRIMGSGMHDFETTGPSGKYLKTRTLPPEADQIMREFMRTSTMDALPNYFHAAARKIAYAERFGAHGEDLEALMNQVRGIQSMDTHDANWFQQQIETVTGGNRYKNMQGLQKLSNGIHALGSIALMPRAAWSALAEPINAALATGSMKVAFQTFGNQFGQLMRTASAAERTEMAEYLGTVMSGMHDSIMMSRMSADYSDSLPLNRWMTRYYKATGLTQLTNSQRIAATAASNGFLAKLSRDYQGGGVNAKDNATRWFNELGLGEETHAPFAKWMTDLNGRPSLDQLRTDPMAGAYGLATRRLVDRIIQDPYKVDRAAMSSVPMAGLAFQLMSFNYQFQRNVLQPLMDNIGHAYTRGTAQAQAAGANPFSARFQGGLAATGSAIHAATGAGAVIAAGVLVTAMRQMLFAPDQMQKHIEDGDIGEYLLDLAMQRSGLNGTLDPLLQISTNLRYGADLNTLMEGASINWLAKNAQDVISPFVLANDSPNTNTRYFNAMRGAINLLGVPAAALGLSKLGEFGGVVGRGVAGAALQYGTAPGTVSTITEAAVGPKGAKREPETSGLAKLSGLEGLQSLQGLPELGKAADEGGPGGGDLGTGGGIPWGLADDVAKPAWQVLGEPVTGFVSRLPGPVKVLGGLGAAAYGGAKFLETTAPFRGQPAPARKQATGQ